MSQDFCVIELGGDGLTAFRNHQLLNTSPGYANLSEAEIVLGEAAERRARLEPLQTISHFWNQLHQQPLTVPGHSSQTPADIAYLHLSKLQAEAGITEKRIIFVVPGNLNQQQLGLLLGIAERCQLQPIAVVNAAVATAAGWLQKESVLATDASYFYLDLHLHQTLLTRLDIEDNAWLQGQVTTFPIGALALKEQLVQLIANQFIHELRFDPLHEARTEQFLYNSLPRWLQALKSQNNLQIQLDDGRQNLTLTNNQIQERLAAVFLDTANKISQQLDPQSKLFISHRLTPYQGLLSGLAAVPGVEFLEVSENTASLGIGQVIDILQTHGEGVPLVTRLQLTTAPQEMPTKPPAVPETPTAVPETPPVAPETPSAVPETPPKTIMAATHLLSGHQAFSLAHPGTLCWSGQDLILSGQGEQVATLVPDTAGVWLQNSSAKLLLNGTPVQSSRMLVAGDVLAVESCSLLCIRVHS